MVDGTAPVCYHPVFAFVQPSSRTEKMDSPRPRTLALSLLLAAGALPGAGGASYASAQAGGADSAGSAVSAGRCRPGALVVPGSAEDEDRRAAQLTGGAPAGSGLLRSTSTLSDAGCAGARFHAFLRPRGRVVLNSSLPETRYQGALWAGRGASVLVSAGLRGRRGALSYVLAPEVTYAQNAGFDLIPSARSGYSIYLPPWRQGLHSADLPLRFGDRPLVALGPGQSSVAVGAGPVALGFGTESQWWGPGQRNALVMSSNAAGIPHLFVRSARPLRTFAGALELDWTVGALTQSPFFSEEAELRSLSGVAATFTPRGEPNLTLGAAHTAVRRAPDAATVTEHAFDAFFLWQSPDTLRPAQGAMQLVSLFGRWAFPQDGVEVYGEWAHHRVLSLRQMLLTPNRAQGYTLGLSWVRPRGDGRRLMLRAELTDLEQSPTFKTRPDASFYTSPVVLAGYTQRGKPIGAAIGPGASSQWLALDWLRPDRSFGLFAERVRWDDDAFYTRPDAWQFNAHDVSLLLGGRVRRTSDAADVALDVVLEHRQNYLYQNPSTNFEAKQAVNKNNLSLRLSFTPRR
jgi:hypothetical protein